MYNLKSIIAQLKINSKNILNRIGAYFVGTFSILGVIGILFDIPNIREEMEWSYCKWIAIIMMALLSLLLLFGIISTIIVLTKKSKVVESCINNKYKVYVEYGDILSDKYCCNNNKILISFNRCFDTIVDDKLIRHGSLHGQVINKLKNDGYTLEVINNKIKTELKNEQHEVVERKDKPQGNLSRYKAGTIIEYKETDYSYYFLGLSWLDKNLHANYTTEDQMLCIQKAIEYHKVHSNQKKLIIPLIGGGNTGTMKSEKQILDLMINLFGFNKDLINSDIHIVIREDAKKDIEIYSL